jgi:hypothetical protein
MRAAPVAGDSQMRVIRICAPCAHAPNDRPRHWDAGPSGEIAMHTASRPSAGVRGAGR